MIIYNNRLFDNRLFFWKKIDCEQTINFIIDFFFNYDYFHNRPSLILQQCSSNLSSLCITTECSISLLKVLIVFNESEIRNLKSLCLSNRNLLYLHNADVIEEQLTLLVSKKFYLESINLQQLCLSGYFFFWD